MGKKKQAKKLVPRLRFPEFREEGGWEEAKLGQLATVGKGKGISKADVVENGKLPCVRYGELYTIYDEVIYEVASRTNLPLEELVLSECLGSP